MEIRERIVMLDDLLVLNVEIGLAQDKVAGLVDFLATSPQEQREAILEYIREGDRFNRFERFAGIANLPKAERDNILKAMGMQPVVAKNFMLGLFDSHVDEIKKAKQVVNELAAVRGIFEEQLLEPILRLFGQRKKTAR